MCVDRGREGGHLDAEDLTCSLEQGQVTEGFGRRGKDQESGTGGERVEALGVRLLDPVSDPLAAGCEPASNGCDIRYPRELEEGEWVAVALRDELPVHRSIERPWRVSEEQRSRIPVPEAADRHLREPGKNMITDARSCRTDERDRLGQEAMSDKAEGLLRRLVEPLRVVDDADQGLLLGQLAHEREGREPDHEPVRSRAGTEPEHGRQRLALWLWKPFELTQHRGADLVEPAVGELELGLDSDGARDAPAIEPVREVVEQRALADARLAAKDRTRLWPLRTSAKVCSSASRSA